MITGLVWALLVATTAAFVVTEALKLERPPVGQFRASRIFSPACSCPKQMARLSFRLRRADSLDVAIVDEEGDSIRTLAEGVRRRRGRVAFRWGGRDDAGGIVPDGTYRLRVRLAREDRTVTFGRRITVDTTRPTIELLGVEPTRLAPGGEGISIRLEVSEPARVFLLVDGKRAARFGRLDSGTEGVFWRGSARDRALPSGRYQVVLRARDAAGNRSRLTRAVQVEIVRSGG